MNTVFLETSALLRMLLGEEGGDLVLKRLGEADRVVASRLVRIEVERALIRLSLDFPKNRRQLSELDREVKHLWPKIDFLEITKDVCDLAGRVSPMSRLRSLDAIHLATFLKARGLEPEMQMLTFDDRLRQEL